LFVGFGAFISFLLISLYGLLNYFLTIDFFNMFKYHIDELSFMTQTKQVLSRNQLVLYTLLNTYIYQISQPEVEKLLDYYRGATNVPS